MVFGRKKKPKTISFIDILLPFLFFRSNRFSITNAIWIQFSHSVMSDSLQPHESQHARPPCPSPAPGVHWDSRPLSQWCHPTISSSIVLFSSCPQSFPASGSFQRSQFFASGGQITGVSASTSVLPMNTLDWSPLGWTGFYLSSIMYQSVTFTYNFTAYSSVADMFDSLWHYEL